MQHVYIEILGASVILLHIRRPLLRGAGTLMVHSQVPKYLIGNPSEPQVQAHTLQQSAWILWVPEPKSRIIITPHTFGAAQLEPLHAALPAVEVFSVLWHEDWGQSKGASKQVPPGKHDFWGVE